MSKKFPDIPLDEFVIKIEPPKGSAGKKPAMERYIGTKIVEAFNMVRSLGMNDRQQPPRPNPAHPPLSMYGTCAMTVWDAWEARHAQATMFET